MGRPPIGQRAMTAAESQRAYRARRRERKASPPAQPALADAESSQTMRGVRSQSQRAFEARNHLRRLDGCVMGHSNTGARCVLGRRELGAVIHRNVDTSGILYVSS